ncbi:uncharacterized protein LOC135489335 [Lineus longissimus]|uniref:uncharacterized protein LOC135489335 n=1 Tax=Lineus longissimus TaxID=88925 RepID=UPI00315CAE63
MDQVLGCRPADAPILFNTTTRPTPGNCSYTPSPEKPTTSGDVPTTTSGDEDDDIDNFDLEESFAGIVGGDGVGSSLKLRAIIEEDAEKLADDNNDDQLDPCIPCTSVFLSLSDDEDEDNEALSASQKPSASTSKGGKGKGKGKTSKAKSKATPKAASASASSSTCSFTTTSATTPAAAPPTTTRRRKRSRIEMACEATITSFQRSQETASAVFREMERARQEREVEMERKRLEAEERMREQDRAHEASLIKMMMEMMTRDNQSSSHP